MTPLALPPPSVRGGVAHGEVLHVDRFGNAITNLPADVLAPATEARLTLGRRRRVPLPLRRTYEDVAPSEALLLVSSFELLELAVREGSAADRFRISVGTPVTLERERRGEEAAHGRSGPRALAPDRVVRRGKERTPTR